MTIQLDSISRIEFNPKIAAKPTPTHSNFIAILRKIPNRIVNSNHGYFRGLALCALPQNPCIYERQLPSQNIDTVRGKPEYDGTFW